MPFAGTHSAAGTAWVVAALAMATTVRSAMVADEAAGERKRRGSAARGREDRVLFERHLHRRAPVARALLVERFLPLARQLARRYERPEVPLDDLFQVACLGLVK